MCILILQVRSWFLLALGSGMLLSFPKMVMVMVMMRVDPVWTTPMSTGCHRYQHLYVCCRYVARLFPGEECEESTRSAMNGSNPMFRRSFSDSGRPRWRIYRSVPAQSDMPWPQSVRKFLLRLCYTAAISPLFSLSPLLYCRHFTFVLVAPLWYRTAANSDSLMKAAFGTMNHKKTQT